MPSPVQPTSNHQRTSPAPCLILASRLQYSPCHIRVPDLDQPMAAIQVGKRYYSFFKASSDCKKILGITVKLNYRGDRTALNKTAKGYGVWVWEPEARPAQTNSPRSKNLIEPVSCRFLLIHNQYQSVEISVPDLDKSLSAIVVDGTYYSIFRVLSEADKILDLVAKMTQRGDETVIIRAQGGFAVCVREPEAQPCSTAP